MKIGLIIDRFGSIASIAALLIVLIPIFLKINAVEQRTRTLEQQLIKVQLELESNRPEMVLRSYFYYIEQDDLLGAWNVFTENKKNNTKDGFQGFQNWLNNFVAFEGLKITNLSEKDSASTKVYLAEFDFKKRGMKPVPSKWGFYLKFNGKDWQIDYSSILYEHNWKNGACEFYPKFSICNL